MRSHTAQPPQQQQQQLQTHHQPQYCNLDNHLKQQQNFLKNHPNLQQSQQQTTNHYHPHQLQQHPLNHVLQQQQPPPPHMWNPHLNAAACYASQSPNNNKTMINSVSNPNHLNIQNCRPFPSSRMYQNSPHYPTTNNGYSHNIPSNTQTAERMPLTAPNYAKLPPLSVVNQQRINECAGIPLISTATAHLTPGQRQRISRKQSHSPPGKNWSNVMVGNAAQNYAAAAQYAAAHAQGAPLMLNKQQQQKPEYWSANTYANGNNPQQQQQQYATKAMQYNGKQQDKTRTPLRYQNSAPASLTSSKTKENLEQQKQTKDTENSSSNNGDSSNSNEACLPRIIKPRKRRKKDRKPTNNLVNAVYLKMDTKSLQDKSSNAQSSNIKSFKSTEDLLKCLQKFTQITNLNELKTSNNHHKTDTNYNSSKQNKKDQFSTCSSHSSDINHGICFCNECDPLRSIWDYPLRRSLSDSSSSETSGTGSLSDNNTTSSNDSSEVNWPKNRADIVGVIGSKRNKEQQNTSYNSNNILTSNNSEHKLFNNNILSGINLASELFKPNNTTAFSNLDNALNSSTDNMLLLSETAETLLTKSINEISKKLIETCSNESCDLPLSSCNSLSSFSTTSSNSSSANSTCADFSNDSGIESAHINAGDDLVFNFDNLHITTTKLSLSPSSLSSSASTASTSSSTPSSSFTSSCGNISMSSSPTVKFASNFLTSTALPIVTAATVSTTTATTTTTNTIMPQTPLTPNNNNSNNIMGTTTAAAPTLDFLVDLNNNHLHVVTAAATTTAPKTMISTENNNKQQFNDLLQKHQPPQSTITKTTTSISTPTLQQHDQQFFNNCFDLMWQQHERQLGNNTNNNTNNLHIDQLTSSSALTSNNVAMSSFLDSVGSLKTVFSTIS